MTGPKINPAAIDLLANYFNSHKKGLPEWLKNAREVYLALGSTEPIIVNFMRDSTPQYIECIDFAGISGTEIEERYVEWAKPDAVPTGVNRRQAEGGQGNGGKAYLRQMFEQGYFISIREGKLSVVSFTDKKKHVLDFVPDRATGKDSSDENPVLPQIRAYAASWLDKYGLPADHNITIVRGIAPKKPIDVQRLLIDIQQFPQARETIRTCNVEFFVNRVRHAQLTVREPALHRDFPSPVTVAVPEELSLGTYRVPTCREPEYPPGELELCVTGMPLVGQSLSSWNRIDFYGTGVSNIGHIDVQELPLKFPQYANHLFGRCRVPLLKDPNDNYEMQGRGRLNEGTLSKALYAFIAVEADKVLKTLSKSLEAKVATKKRKNLEKLNDKLASWLESQFTALSGLAESGSNEGSGTKARKKRQPKTHAPAAELKIHRQQLDVCLGVNSYTLRAVAYDAEGKPVPPGKVVWRANDPSIVKVNPQTGSLEPVSMGVSTVTVQNDGGLTSMPALVTVHQAIDIRIKTRSLSTLGSNRRLPLNTVVKTSNGKNVKNPAVTWHSEDRFVVAVGQDGIAIGGEIGETMVRASAGDLTSNDCEIEVERGASGLPQGGGKGRPRILLSGQNPCPFDRKAVLLDTTDPPVHQRAYKPDYANNVFWINLQHPLAADLPQQRRGFD